MGIERSYRELSARDIRPFSDTKSLVMTHTMGADYQWYATDTNVVSHGIYGRELSWISPGFSLCDRSAC